MHHAAINPPLREVLLISSGRNGSNFLLSQLAASGDIYPFGEIFKKGSTRIEYQYFLDKKREEQLTPSQNDQLNNYIATALSAKGLDILRCALAASGLGARPKPIAVFKVFVEHLFFEFKAVDDCINVLLHSLRSSSKVIILFRNRLVDIFLSTQRAAKEDNWIGREYTVTALGCSEEDYLCWRDWYLRTWILSLRLLEEAINQERKDILPLAFEELVHMSPRTSVSSLSRFIFNAEPSEYWLDTCIHEESVRQSVSVINSTLPPWVERYSNDSFQDLVLASCPGLCVPWGL